MECKTFTALKTFLTKEKMAGNAFQWASLTFIILSIYLSLRWVSCLLRMLATTHLPSIRVWVSLCLDRSLFVWDIQCSDNHAVQDIAACKTLGRRGTRTVGPHWLSMFGTAMLRGAQVALCILSSLMAASSLQAEHLLYLNYCRRWPVYGATFFSGMLLTKVNFSWEILSDFLSSRPVQ